MKRAKLQLDPLSGSFPLPLREREKCFQRLGKATMANGSHASGFYDMGQRLFLPLWGEGQDEGESDAILLATPFRRPTTILS